MKVTASPGGHALSDCDTNLTLQLSGSARTVSEGSGVGA